MEFNINNEKLALWEEDEEQIILNAKRIYTIQKNKVKDEIYIENLLYADFVKMCKKYKHRYDYVCDIMPRAFYQQNATKKREKQDFLTIEAMLISDFFNSYKEAKPKLVKIMEEGYEGYAYDFYIECMNFTFNIEIPMVNRVNINNFDCVHECKIALYDANNSFIKESICFSYKIEDIAEAIKNYIEINKKEGN